MVFVARIEVRMPKRLPNGKWLVAAVLDDGPEGVISKRFNSYVEAMTGRRELMTIATEFIREQGFDVHVVEEPATV
jgi:hypothetical protein